MSLRADRGNILFLILLAVVLFAALSYAVTSSLRGGGKSASSESVETAAATLIQYGVAMSNAVNRLKLVNGCDDNQISYEQTPYPVSNANPRAPSSKKCHVFDAAGGGMTPFVLPAKWQDPSNTYTAGYLVYRGYNTYTGSANFVGIGTPTLADVLLGVPFISDEICAKINEKMGITSPPSYFYYIEVLGPSLIREPPTYMDSYTPGYYSQCILKQGTNTPNTFVAVLIAR